MNIVGIPDADLNKLLNDRAHLRQQVTELQTRNTELLMENRELKRALQTEKAVAPEHAAREENRSGYRRQKGRRVGRDPV